MNLKSTIFSLLPYRMATSIKCKKNQALFNEYCSSSPITFPEVDSKYQYIVSCQGFGYSGSGVIGDLLREYDLVDVFGSIDIEGSMGTASTTNEEIDFIRHTGGILDFEKHVSGNNVFHNDAAIHLLIENFINSSLCKRFPACRELAKQFIANLIEAKCDCRGRSAFNVLLQSAENQFDSIIYIKNKTNQEYRELSKHFLTHFFNALHKRESNILVLDQLFCDFEFDESRNRDYVPNLKTIIVFRDPRDIFAFANQKKITWLPYEDVDSFISMYKIFLSRFDFNSPDYLVIRFEDIVTEQYEFCVKRVEDFLDLNSTLHTRPKSYFDPQSSCKSIGRWRNYPELFESFAKIERELPKICYQG